MAIDVQSKKFDLSELLSTSFDLLKSQFKPVLKASLLPGGIILAVSVVFGAAVFLVMRLADPFNPQQFNVTMPVATITITLVFQVIYWILFAIAISLVVISVFQVTADSCGGQPIPTPREILRRAWGRVAAFWGTWALLLLGVIVLIVPIQLIPMAINSQIIGILTSLVVLLLFYSAAIYITFAFEVVALRGQSGVDAIRTSCSLVKGRFWKTFGYLFVLGLVGGVAFMVPMLVIQLAMGFLIPQNQSLSAAMIGLVVILVVFISLLMFLFLLFTLIGKTLMFLAWEKSKADLQSIVVK